jgi:AraC family transcriptional regulator
VAAGSCLKASLNMMNSRLQYIQNWPMLAQKANWSAAILAKECGVSLRTLERYFNKTFSKSPHDWLSGDRHQRAIALLQSGDAVKGIAAYLGYKHATHFSREFKVHYGRCPTTKAELLQSEERPMS